VFTFSGAKRGGGEEVVGEEGLCSVGSMDMGRLSSQGQMQSFAALLSTRSAASSAPLCRSLSSPALVVSPLLSLERPGGAL